jgi:predicted RNA-binding Zn-ribbon protein involved in translation (DUF1610 family)
MYGKPGTMTGKKHTIDAKEKMSSVHRGKTLSEAHKKRISQVKTGRVVSEQTRQKLHTPNPDGFGASRSGNLNPNFGKTHSEVTRAKMAASSAKKQKFPCPHCGKQLLRTHLVRYHGDKCNQRSSQ